MNQWLFSFFQLLMLIHCITLVHFSPLKPNFQFVDSFDEFSNTPNAFSVHSHSQIPTIFIYFTIVQIALLTSKTSAGCPGNFIRRQDLVPLTTSIALLYHWTIQHLIGWWELADVSVSAAEPKTRWLAFIDFYLLIKFKILNKNYLLHKLIVFIRINIFDSSYSYACGGHYF